MTATAPFVRIAALLQIDLQERLALHDPDDCDAIIGNLAHECDGFTVWHEIGQPPEKGGIGWGQWTGPRRRKFESYCAEHKYDPRSYLGQLEYLIFELTGAYHNAVLEMMAAPDLRAKVDKFEETFEVAGVPALASRYRWALKSRGLRTTKAPPPVAVVEKPLWARILNYVLSPWV
jgi:hypothetical protein